MKKSVLRNKVEQKIKSVIHRIPSKKIDQLRIALLQKWKEKKETAVIFPKPDIKKYPGIYFWGMICKDWPGSAGTTMSVITESGWDIATHWGMSIYYERKKVGLMVVGIEMKDKDELMKFLADKKRIKEKLKEVSFEGWRKAKLLVHNVKKMEKCEEVIKILKERNKFTEGIAEECIKFFDNRTEEYLDQRSSNDLADIILTNYRFIQSIRRTGGEPQVRVKHLKTTKEMLTGITIGCYEADFSLLLALDAIREALPDYVIKYNKEFVTDDKISIYRIEIDGFQPEKRIENSIIKKLRNMKFEKESIREVARGLEHYGKAIIPKLIKEYSLSKIPQVYISPELTSQGFIHFKVIVVKEVNSPWTDKYIAKIDEINGITVTGCETPKIYQDSEVSVIDLRVETKVFHSITSIYTTIGNELKEILGEFRDFGQGMREIDIERFGEVRRKVKGVKLNLIREFYYGIEEFYRISGEENEVVELVRLGVKLALGKVTNIKWKEIEDRCSLIAIASKENIFPQVLKMLEGYQTVASKIELGNLNFSLIRVEDKGKPIPSEKLLSIIHMLAKRLEIPVEKLGW